MFIQSHTPDSESYMTNRIVEIGPKDVFFYFQTCLLSMWMKKDKEDEVKGNVG